MVSKSLDISIDNSVVYFSIYFYKIYLQNVAQYQYFRDKRRRGLLEIVYVVIQSYMCSNFNFFLFYRFVLYSFKNVVLIFFNLEKGDLKMAKARKNCPNCNTGNLPARLRVCPNCQHEFYPSRAGAGVKKVKEVVSERVEEVVES